MGQGFKHGASRSGLDLRVQAYATEEDLLASAAKDNTVGVVMGGVVTAWAFCKAQPADAADNTVWICTGTASNTAMNLDRKNVLMLYPIFAKVCTGGNWNTVKSYVRICGGWVKLDEEAVVEYLIKDGTIDMTAHKHSCNTSYDSAVNASVYNNEKALKLEQSNGGVNVHSFADVAVPAWAKKFKAQYYLLAAYNGYDPVISLGEKSVTVECKSGHTLKNGTAELDVSGIAGTSVTLGISCKGYSGCYYSYIGNAWFE